MTSRIPLGNIREFSIEFLFHIYFFVILWIIKERMNVKKIGILDLKCSVSSSLMNFLNEIL